MARTIVKGLIFVALPLCVLEMLLAVGVVAPAPDTWYGEVIRNACRGRVDFVFAGSSQVAAAIQTDAFARRVAAVIGTPVTAVNMGRGYTTLAEDALALRALYERCGDSMTGASVFIEAPEGLPSFATFHDPWVHSDQPALILPLMRPRDLVRFWAESRTPIADKAEVTARLLRSVNYIAVTQSRILRVGEELRQRVARRVVRATVGAAQADLSSGGGILVERQAVERARRLAVSHASETFKDDVDWSATVLMDINRLVQSHAGRLIVFRMPLSSVRQSLYHTRVRRAAERFRREAAAAGIAYLHASMTTVDDDFPDYWHLRKSRAGEFSQQVADEYLAVVLRVRERHLGNGRPVAS